jgi:general secretion pathway protein F
MATLNYHFRAVAADGKLRTGTIPGETDKVVAAELRRQGLTPIYVGVEAKKSFEFKNPFSRRGNRRDVLLFTQELSTLLNAGIPLDRALSITSELTERASFKVVVQDIIRVLKGGKSLADSFASKPEHFSELYINMVRAGEASGSLAAVFERLAEFEKTRDELRNYIVSSLVYPGLLTIAGTASVIFLLTFVVPRFAQVFEDSHLVMPTPTRIMLESSKIIKTYGWLVLAALAIGFVSFRGYIATGAGRLWWDGFRLKIPVLGVALRKAEVARFARAMSTLVANSVPLVQCIAISGATLNNKRIAGSLTAVAQGVKRGEGIATPLRRTGEFPPLASHLLAVGEETGHLDHMFGRMAEIYETETRTAIRRFTALFEPLIILVMGIVVGALILSMLIAITSMNEVAI